jgi:hypothetical protein
VWYDRLPANKLVHRFGGKLGRKGRIIFFKHFAKARQRPAGAPSPS